jgi:hypothetical protein
MNITLREIIADTVRAVCGLVAEPAGDLAPNAISIAQALCHAALRPQLHPPAC